MGGTGVVMLGTEMYCQPFFSSQNSIELFNLRSTAWDKVVVGLDLDSTGSLGYSR